MRKTIPFLMFLLLLSACGEKSIHKQIITHLDEAFDAEEAFSEYQEELLQLEERDLAIYDEIVQLDDSQVEDLEQLIAEALQIIEQRDAYLQAEKTAIKQSKSYFIESEALIDLIQEEESANLLAKLFETMLKRYESYEDVYEAYGQSLDLTENLYEHLQDNHSPVLLNETIEDINDSYERLFQANDQFNRLTKEYNRLKKEYYALVWE
ncbi:MAG TPA: YkyA family protein [Pseudogracilibacillus sp.]|nr:YkyA family protein [Pseudogracilibacillus sp.]